MGAEVALATVDDDVAPEIHEVRGDSRKVTTSATSCGCPGRPKRNWGGQEDAEVAEVAEVAGIEVHESHARRVAVRKDTGREEAVDIRSGQRLAWENKKDKGFNTTDVPLEFCLLQGEVAEAFDAWRKGREDVGEELADIAIYLFSLAEMTRVDLQTEVEAKIARNAARSYRPLSNGVLVKSDDEPTATKSPEGLWP